MCLMAHDPAAEGGEVWFIQGSSTCHIYLLNALNAVPKGALSLLEEKEAQE